MFDTIKMHKLQGVARYAYTLRGARNLDYSFDMSRFLRAGQGQKHIIQYKSLLIFTENNENIQNMQRN